MSKDNSNVVVENSVIEGVKKTVVAGVTAVKSAGASVIEGVHTVEKVSIKVKKAVELGVTPDEDVDLEGFKALMAESNITERAKLIAWGSVKATDPQVRKYCRIRSGGTIGVAAIVTGALGYYACS